MLSNFLQPPIGRSWIDDAAGAEAILSRNQDGIELALDAGTYLVTPGCRRLQVAVIEC